MALTVRRPKTAAAPARLQPIVALPAVRGGSTGGAVIIDATARMQCFHEFIGYPGYLRCGKCEFRVSQLPLSKRGAIVLPFRNAGTNP